MIVTTQLEKIQLIFQCFHPNWVENIQNINPNFYWTVT